MDTAAAECERQADGQKVETEGERERGEKNVGDMKICKGTGAKYKSVKNAVFCFSMRCSDDTYEIGMS